MVLVLPLLACCKGGDTSSSPHSGGQPIELGHATNLSMTRHTDYVAVEMRNPWDTTKILHTYLLVADSIPLPPDLPPGTVVRTPLKKSLVYSSIHNSLLTKLGAMDAIAGVCDADFIRQPKLREKIEKGEVADCGKNTSPNIEKIIRLKPDAILLSPFEDSGSYGKLGQLGIPIIECADYMEDSPLGRAEWMKFFGLLYGCEDEADDMFSRIDDQYLALKEKAAATKNKPRVLIDRLYGQSWYVPRAQSTMGQFITDAGGENPFAKFSGYGSIGLSGEQVLHQAGDADIWLIRYSQDNEMTLKELSAENAIYPRFAAFKKRAVYGCNTSEADYFEEVPFHPHWLLAHLISVLHPELATADDAPVYFKPIAP